MLNTLIIAAFFMVVFFGAVFLYKQKKKWAKFNNEWKLNFEIINNIMELTKENRSKMRELVKNVEIQQPEKIDRIEENYDKIMVGCNTLTERLGRLYQDNVGKEFKYLEVEIERKMSDKDA